MRRKPAINLQTFPADPPSLATPPQVPDGGATYRQVELRAKALELAVQTVTNHELTAAFLGEEILERGDPLALADRYLAYINGDRP